MKNIVWHFPKFLEAMHEEYERHYDQKGDSWQDMKLDDLRDLLYNCYEKFADTEDNSEDELGELVDMATIICMIGQRLIVNRGNGKGDKK